MKKFCLAMGLAVLFAGCDSGGPDDGNEPFNSVETDSTSDSPTDSASGTVDGPSQDTTGADSATMVATDFDTGISISVVDTQDTVDSGTDDMAVKGTGADSATAVDSESGDSDTGWENPTDSADDDTSDSDTISSTDTIPNDTAPADTADTSDTADVADTGTESCTPTLVINEVDYDVPGKDTAEFVELFNPTECDMPLSGIFLILVNGSDMTEYRRIELIDCGETILPGGKYLLIHGFELPGTVLVPSIEMTLASGFLQNGPDALALFDASAQTVLDSFCYEAEMSAVTFDGVDGTFNLVEGEIDVHLADSGDEGVSLGRIPNGSDSGNTFVDWTLVEATPGTANIILTP
ncbi:MAG: lamin tail domain-containing protein [Deltaproteobacteria bacterium]|nr:lamin tail domain-containing protein [Deltaproteobacteria bacterium]